MSSSATRVRQLVQHQVAAPAAAPKHRVGSSKDDGVRGHRQTVLRARAHLSAVVVVTSNPLPRPPSEPHRLARPSLVVRHDRVAARKKQERGWPCAWAQSCRGTYGEANHRYPYHTNLPDKLCSRCAAASVPCGQPRGGCPGSAGPWGRDGASHRAAASAQRSLTTHEQVRGRAGDSQSQCQRARARRRDPHNSRTALKKPRLLTPLPPDRLICDQSIVRVRGPGSLYERHASFRH